MKNNGGASDADVKWLKRVDAEDFDAARRYLALVFAPRDAKALTASLEKAPMQRFPAKDVLRASEQPPKPRKDPDVAKQLKRIERGKPLSPVLLVRVPGQAKLLVADGYHRVCAAYLHNEDEPVPCKIA
ncbi:MAG: hypothetical protein ACXWC6_04560 [Ramlibacter sp.]